MSIAELAHIVAEVVGFEGEIQYATDKPDGAPQKLLDTTKLTQLGWTPRTKLREGLEDAYDWFVKHRTDCA